MEVVGVLFLAVGIVNLVFARQGQAGSRWNLVMGVDGAFVGAALLLLGNAAAPVLWAGVPVMLLASYLHNRATPAADAEVDFEPPV